MRRLERTEAIYRIGFLTETVRDVGQSQRMTSKTQYYVASSIDGFIADRHGGIDWLLQFDKAEGISEHYQHFMEGVGALAMGATTYEWVANHLGSSGSWPYGDLPTWIFTHRSLPPVPGANLRFTSDDPGAVHAEMTRAANGKNIWLIGGGALVGQFVERGLLDELWLTIVPVTLGAGAPLLPVSQTRPTLTLLSVTRFGAGAVELRYELPKPGAQ